ncbi:NAD(P)/FAD-dependent oxidoreductase [Mollicutes bacterium LVI A0039]|nr:NAD(P)/FAD-dependent oxidoreductase [Mollicutes bacterium LVI A0039]
MSKKNIVIVGGGYAGVLTAKKLIKKLKKQIKAGEVELTLVDRQPYHTLMTELHEAAFDRTNSEAIKVYHHKIFNQKYINLKLANVENIDYQNKVVETDNGNLKYDYLVEATGAKVAHFGVAGAEEHTIPMWSFDDTRTAMSKVLELFDRAEKTSNIDKRRELLTFVVAGAGFTGVEVAGELKEWIDRTLLYKYPTIKPSEVSMYVIDGAERILNSFGDKSAAKVAKRMENKLGINLILNSFITKVEADKVYFGEGNSIATQCVLWTSGITCAPISPDSLELERGNRIKVNANLQTEGKDGAYVLGDIMYYIPEGKDMPVPQMVENCEHAAPVVATNIANEILNNDKPLKSYAPEFHGAMACVGGRYGVAELHFAGRALVMSGFFAMFVKHFINVIYLLQATSLTKVWMYIRHEFFEVRDRRSFIGGNLASKSPSIYLVPLRLWLGWYWLASGAPKLIHKLQGGWEAVCVETEIFPSDVKNYGDFCTSVYPQGETAFNLANGIGVPDASGGASAVVETASQAVDGVAGATGVIETASQVVDGVAGATDFVETVAPIAEVEPTGLLAWIDNFFAGLAPVSTPFGMGYDINALLPDFLEEPIYNLMVTMVTAISGMEWLMELVFDLAEVGLGLLLIIGLFTEFAALALLILSISISAGSWMSYDGIVVLGLLFSICASIPLINIGGYDVMPLSADYFIRPWYKKRKLKKRDRK